MLRKDEKSDIPCAPASFLCSFLHTFFIDARKNHLRVFFRNDVSAAIGFQGIHFDIFDAYCFGSVQMHLFHFFILALLDHTSHQFGKLGTLVI